MHSETNTIILNDMQQQPNNLQQLTQHQQHNMTHLSQNHQQQDLTHLSSTAETATSLSEGLCVPPFMYPLCSTSRHYQTTTSSSPSSSSCSSSSSSDESYYPCPNSSESQIYKNSNKHTTSIGVNLRVTGQCSQGGRKYMEDYFSVAYQQSENAKDLEYAFIGIYDGHGGAEAAKFAKEHLMMQIINQRPFWSDNDYDVLRAIREGYIATHYAMWREQDKWPKTANGLPSTAGTTATVAFIKGEKIYIGHVGDSGIVLGYQNENENFWRAKQLTIDHKPESVEERTRIMNSGGKVVVKSGVPRVVWNRPRNASHRGPIRKKTLIDEIPFLAVARSLGDLWSYNSERNEFVVSPDPDVKVIPINSNTFRCLIFGTDGLWNVVTPQEAVNTVREKEAINEHLLAQRGDSPHEGNQWTNPSKSLVDQALRTWSNKKMRADNTSVVTVLLYPPGQIDHCTEVGCREIHKDVNHPPAYLEPISYGLEYTQVQAEVPAYDDATTYKEMALKYLPPEAYRNFNYNAEESDTEGDDNDNEESEEEHDMMVTEKCPSGDLQQNTNYNQHFTTSTNWNWEENNANNYTKPVQAETEKDEEEDEGDEEEMKGDAAIEKHVGNERQVCIVNYQNYVHMGAEDTNNATDCYINTFAESYNSILTTSQDECVAEAKSSASSSSSNSNSNSNSNCQSVTPPNMHAILQEQQLYQQQCMSEEEGYSLTKLETRREQQTCKGYNRAPHLSNETRSAVQTFKIFHESEQVSSPPQQQPPHQTELYHSNAERFYHQQQQFAAQVVQKPLELQSLLQQEREEEQRVAYERLQMENKLQQHQCITAYACLQTTNSIGTASDNHQPSLEVEYRDGDSPVTEEVIISAENSSLQQDESVQINEISSSSCGDESRLLDTKSSEVDLGQTEKVEKIEILPNATAATNNTTNKTPEEVKSNGMGKKSKYPTITMSESGICHPSPPSQIVTSYKSTKRSKSSYLYNNVPNENLQRISSSKYTRNMFSSASRAPRNCKISLCMTPSTSMTPPAATSTPIIRRQLRSTTTHCSNTPNATPVMDYGKRTLRTRNSLAKDMKAKSALVQTALKYPQNAVTRNFLRTTASNLMVGNPLHMNDLNATPCNPRAIGTANNVRTPNHSSIRTRREKTNIAINCSLNQSTTANIQNSAHPQLNLRSRQTASSSSVTSSPSTNVSALRSPPASTPVIKRASLTERRILRSMHTRSTSSKGSQTPANFSKSTRTQSTGSNLAAPPPSPKLINAVAAVAAATRARSLLNAKHAAAANSAQSVVSAIFGKRSSLRSNGSSHSAAVIPNANTAASLSPPALTHQTLRGRIVKKFKR